MQQLYIWLFVVLLFLSPSLASAWVRIYQPFPDGNATVILQRYCLGSGFCPLEQWEWEELITDAANVWNDAGSGFRFQTRQAARSGDPCQLSRGEVAIIWTDGIETCPGDRPLGYTEGVRGEALALVGTGTARIYFYARHPDHPAAVFRMILPAFLVHELGHVLGLGHPNENGQSVESIMNVGFRSDPLLDELAPDDIAGVRALYGTSTAHIDPSAVTLEIPISADHPDSVTEGVTGIGLISGWACEAESITVRFNDRGEHIPLLYGATRGDTEGVCGHSETGFSLLVNWNILGEGEHTLSLFVDGQERVRQPVRVMTYGQEFLRDVQGRWGIPDWPVPGVTTMIEWDEATQNIRIVTIYR